MNRKLYVLTRGLWKENPVFVLFLGLCPALAATDTAAKALLMGVSTAIVFILSNIVISLLKNILTGIARISCYLVIVAIFVTAVQLLLGYYFPEITKSLTIYIPLIAVSCLILSRAELFAGKNKIGHTLFDSLGMGVGFANAMIVIGVVREFFGFGKVFGFTLISNYVPLTIISGPVGAFLALAVLIAIYNFLCDSLGLATHRQLGRTGCIMEGHCTEKNCGKGVRQ